MSHRRLAIVGLFLVAPALIGPVACAVFADGPYPVEATKPKKAKPRPRPSPTPTPLPTPDPAEFKIADVPEVIPVEEAPPPAPAPPPITAARPRRDGVRFGLQTWGQVAISGEADTKVVPGGRISIDGPLAVGRSAPLRIYARLDITAIPGQEFNPVDVATFGNSAELNLGAYHRIGRLRIGDQEITTAIAGEWGFATAMRGEVLPRYVRHYGAGVRLAELTSGAYLSLLYGRHEAGGEWGWGQWQISGSVPIEATSGALVLGGDAILSVGKSGARQSDVLRLWVGVDVPELIGVFSK